MSRGWIGVDLDGTLAQYDGWQGPEHIGEPVPKMVERVRQWSREMRVVKIMTARVAEPNPVERGRIIKAIQMWCVTHIGMVYEITNVKDYAMIELWDDRAVQVIPNTGERADGKP